MSCRLDRKQRLTLKQLGFSQVQIESALAKMCTETIDFNSLIKSLTGLYTPPRMLSTSWSPPDRILTVLMSEGFIDHFIDLLIPLYIYEIRDGIINPRDVDAFFSQWARNRIIAPQKPSDLMSWKPGKQLIQWKYEFRMTDHQFSEHVNLYKDYIFSKSVEDQVLHHDRAFICFLEK